MDGLDGTSERRRFCGSIFGNIVLRPSEVMGLFRLRPRFRIDFTLEELSVGCGACQAIYLCRNPYLDENWISSRERRDCAPRVETIRAPAGLA